MKLKLSSDQWRVMSDERNGASGRCRVAGHSPLITHHSRRGIALVITLIMLAVTLVMAVAFLAVARRERNAVTTSTDTATARLAADTALAAAQAQVVANILATTNPYNYSLLVSTNYATFGGIIPGAATVNYISYFDTNGNLLTGNNGDYLINTVTNLYLLPRPPVFVPTVKGANDFRYYLDLNRNGLFEANGYILEVNYTNGVIGTNFSAAGDPEWVGVLERPDQPHGPNNKFLARYAFLAQPIGNTLDLNYIHNQVFDENNASTTVYPNISDAFFRNQSVGSWELNLAAFLTDLNTNQWGQVIGSPANGNTAYYYYQYPGGGNRGVAFYDAQALLAWRYANDYGSLFKASQIFINTPFNAANIFPYDNVDNYSDGPLQFSTTNIDESIAVNQDAPNLHWAGSDNTNRFFDLVSDVFDTSRNLGNFTGHLTAAGTNTFGGTTVPTYDRYTFYRMLDELGTDSAADDGRMNVNYRNVTNGVVLPGMETNCYAWGALDFFTNAADRMLRTYTTNWITSSRNGFAKYTNTFGASVTNAFGVANIPVYIDGQFVYSSAVNRILQLAANLYDATINQTAAAGRDYPSVFRPMFSRVGNDVYITGYTNVLTVSGPSDLALTTPFDASTIAAGGGTNVLENIYGVPWIIGAKKGLPNFNEFAMENALTVTRRLQVTRPTINAAGSVDLANFHTNQMYLMSLSSSIGIELWNSYVSNYSGTIEVGIKENATLTITNDEQITPYLFQTTFSTNYVTIPLTSWTGSGVGWADSTGNPAVGSLKTVIFTGPTLTNSVYRSPYATMPSGSGLVAPGFEPTNYFSYFNPGTLNNFETNSPNGFHFPQFGVLVTNRLQVFMLDVTNGVYRVIDYVSFAGPDGGFNVNSNLADPDIGNGVTANYGVWNTNYPSGSSPPNGVTLGILSQISASKSGNAPGEDGAWKSDPEAAVLGTTKQQQADSFKAFFLPGNKSGKATNYLLSVQAPYSPTRSVVQYYSWQANDPLVHYLASDISSIPAKFNTTTIPTLGVNAYNADKVLAPLSGLNLGFVNDRYMPWSGNHRYTDTQLATLDTNRFNLTERDSLVQQSDNWDFPAGKLPSIGWLGRVHRGTPWQTVYLKSTDILTNNGVAVWKDWTGNGITFDATNAAPVSDRLLFDLFSTAPNANATHGTLSVNQTHLAAWSAVLSGLTVPNNSATGYTNIPPAGADAGNSAVGLIVNGTLGINATRAGVTNADGAVGAFEHVGDILATPALTVLSPFVDVNTANDALYEWLPQQTLELLRASSTPRYVVYCYGQTLRPAPNGVVTASGTAFGLVTNYQVTAESAARAVIRVDNATTNAPRVVIESYTPLPPN